MNTEPNSTSHLDRIIHQLDEFTTNLPVEQLLVEMQVVIERLTFSKLYTKNSKDLDFIAEVDLLFEDEISNEVLSFIHWLTKNGMLGILADKTGHLFLNFCIKRYKQLTEVKFLTSIKLTDEMRKYTSEKLRLIYPYPARIIYNVTPSLCAGFIIKDGKKTIDRSLRTAMIKMIEPRIRQRYNSLDMGIKHG